MGQDDSMSIEEIDALGWVSMMLICIQGKIKEDIYGEICSYHLNEPVPFSGIGDMVLKIDEICECIGTPQRTTNPRFMNQEMEKKYRESSNEHPKVITSRLLNRNNLAPIPQAIKARDVLVAIVKYRQNSSIQGTIRGRFTNGKDVSFRSALELMRMMQLI